MISIKGEYIDSRHLSQIYYGLQKLKEAGIITTHWETPIKRIDSKKPVLQLLINNKINVVYDTLDGFNWIDDSKEKNLEFFKNHFENTYYFKRSFTKELNEYCQNNKKVFPLGFNYYLSSKPVNTSKNLAKYLEKKIRASRIICKLFNINSDNIKPEDFENLPFPQKDSRVLFYTRLWCPDNTEIIEYKQKREEINLTRIAAVKACRKEFGSFFTGGIIKDNYSEKIASELTVPNQKTNKLAYISQIKNHDICIATTGLHDSIGWKTGEYVAAARAIVSEPFEYELPGNFQNGQNYIEFTDVDTLINAISLLLNNKNLMHSIMLNNYYYYHSFLRPEIMVLNTFQKIGDKLF